jgi:hypothetical protein
MNWNRKKYFAVGIVIFLLGIQFRSIQSFVLNEPTTRVLHNMAKNSPMVSTDPIADAYMQVAPSPRKTITPPEWLGWALLTVGGVMSLHAMILPKD